MKTATIHYVETHLSQVLKEVQAGESVLIVNGRTPVAKLTAAEPAQVTVPHMGHQLVRDPSAEYRVSRPRVGTRSSEPVHYASDAFQPLTDKELEAWGL